MSPYALQMLPMVFSSVSLWALMQKISASSVRLLHELGVLSVLSQALETCFATLAHIFCVGLFLSGFSPDGPHAIRAAAARASVGESLMVGDVPKFVFIRGQLERFEGGCRCREDVDFEELFLENYSTLVLFLF